MIASLVKEGRIAKGYTQKELSELSNISIRSIQRIENAEILPRSYTLKTLAEILGLSFETLQKEAPVPRRFKINRNQKIILSVGVSLFIFFLAWAFMAQSSSFPETEFELIIFSAIVLLFITSLLAIIWRSKS